VSRFFVGKLVLVSFLHVVASTVPKVVSDNRVYGGWRSIAAAECESLVWQVGGLLLNEAERNARVVSRSEVVLIVGSHCFRLQRHLVQLLEVTGILSRNGRALMDSPVANDLVGSFAVREQVVLSKSEVLGWQVSSEGLGLADVVLNEKNVSLLA